MVKEEPFGIIKNIPLGLKPKNPKHRIPSRIPVNRPYIQFNQIPKPYIPIPSAEPLKSEFGIYKKNLVTQKIQFVTNQMPKHELTLAKCRLHTLHLKEQLGLL